MPVVKPALERQFSSWHVRYVPSAIRVADSAGLTVRNDALVMPISQLKFLVGEKNSQTVVDPVEGQGTGAMTVATAVVEEEAMVVVVVAAVLEVLELVGPIVDVDDDEELR